jgi:hypothetical protein
MTPIEKPGIEMFFQLLDLEGDRRLGHEQHFGRFGKRELLGDGMEHLQSAIGHYWSPDGLLMPDIQTQFGRIR